LRLPGQGLFFLKRAKKLLPYINIGGANKGMARAIKVKKRREDGGKHTPLPQRENTMKRSAHELS
jgi:hypothetical protein